MVRILPMLSIILFSSACFAGDNSLDLPLEKPEKIGKQTPPSLLPTKLIEPPPIIYGQEISFTSKSIFYVLDVSGSMGWDIGQYTDTDGSVKSGNRLERAKAELIKSILSLPKDFKFGILTFDCDIFLWRKEMVEADNNNKKDAVAWVTRQKPQGGTAIGPAVKQALEPKTNKLIILLTDGEPTCGTFNGLVYGLGGGPEIRELHLKTIRANNTQNASINVYGIQTVDETKKFCLAVAAQNNGAYTDVR